MVLNSLRFTRKTFNSPVNINGKVVVITGANAGIGKITAEELAKRGAKIIIGCRDLDKGNKAINEIKSSNVCANIRVIKLDLSSFTSVRQFAERVREEESQIDILINNAGVMMCPKWKTEDGFEMQFGTNHLGHFLLTLLLIDRLKASPNARIVNVSSIGHMNGAIHFEDINLDTIYNPQRAYFQSKLANVLFSRELAHRLSETNIKVYSLHPGIIRTELSRHLYENSSILRFVENIFYISAYMGAQTTLYCALEPSLSNESGKYYSNCWRVDNMVKEATDDVSSRKLWELSCHLVRLEEKLTLN